MITLFVVAPNQLAFERFKKSFRGLSPNINLHYVYEAYRIEGYASEIGVIYLDNYRDHPDINNILQAINRTGSGYLKVSSPS